MGLNSTITSVNMLTFKQNAPRVVQNIATQRIFSEPVQKSIASNTSKVVKNKTGIFAAITAFALAFINIFRRSEKKPKTEVEIPKVVQPPKPIVKEPVKLEFTPENFEMLKKKFIECIVYERSINYSNIKLLQDLPEKERKRIEDYLKYHFDDTKKFLAFITGEAPGALLCVDSNYHDVFLPLDNEETKAANFFWDKGGELVVNKKAAKKIISNNLEFFRIRLGMAENATVDDIMKELFCFTYNSPLRNKNKYADLMQLLIGNDIYDACHAQIIKDIKRGSSRIFYAGHGNSLEEYKAKLKESVLDEDSSYYNMPQSFKDSLIKAIDNIPQESFRNRIEEPIEFIREPKSELEKFRSLERIVAKLEKAQKEGTAI